MGVKITNNLGWGRNVEQDIVGKRNCNVIKCCSPSSSDTASKRPLSLSLMRPYTGYARDLLLEQPQRQATKFVLNLNAGGNNDWFIKLNLLLSNYKQEYINHFDAENNDWSIELNLLQLND